MRIFKGELPLAVAFWGVWLAGGSATSGAVAAIWSELARRLRNRPPLLLTVVALTVLAAYWLAASYITWRSADRDRGRPILQWLARATVLLPFAAVLALAIDGCILYLLLIARPDLLTAI